MFTNVQQKLDEIASALDAAERMGDQEDEPEGSRYIQMSDTLAQRISQELRELAGLLRGR